MGLKLKTPLMKQVLTMLGGNGTAQFLNLLTSTILFNFSSYDNISNIFVYLGVFHIVNHFFDFGINTSFVKIYSNKSSEEKFSLEKSYISLKLYIALAMAFILGALFLGGGFKSVFENMLQTDYFVAFLLACFFEQVSSAQMNLMKTKQDFLSASRVRVYSCLMKLIFTGIAVIVYNNEFYIFLGFYSSSLFSFIFSSYLNGNNYAFEKIHELKKFILKILKSSLWIYLALLSSAMISQVDVFMVKYLLTNRDVSFLVTGQKYASIIPFLSGTLMSVLLPHVVSKKDSEIKAYIFNLVKALPLFIILIPSMIGAAYILFNFILKGEYMNALPIFSVYVTAFSIGMFSSSLSMVLFQSNNERLIAYMVMGQVVLNIIVNYYFINIWGAAGAALATCILKISSLIITSLFIFKKINLKEN